MKRIIGFSFIVLSVILFSCQNEKIEVPQISDDLDKKSAEITMTETAIESATTEVDYEVDFYANAEVYLTNWLGMGKFWRWSNGLRYKINHCPNLNIESVDGDYPKIITLDYGDSTLLRSGKVLSGVVIIEISGPRTDDDYTRLITYQDFGVDSLLINGTAQVSINRDEDLFRTFISDVTISLPDETTIDRTSERNWEWIEGIETDLDQFDDVIQITGFTNAETSNGDVYQKDITEPLIRIRDCRYIVKGIVDITMNGSLVSSLDYGDGECNDIAILTQGGETYEVDLTDYRCMCLK